MNRELLIKVRETLVAHESRFDYSDFVRDRLTGLGQVFGEHLMISCNTVACVAGWTCAIVDPTKEINWYADDHARDYLKLSQEEANFLFFCHALGPFEYKHTSEATFQDALDRIDYLLSDSYTK